MIFIHRAFSEEVHNYYFAVAAAAERLAAAEQMAAEYRAAADRNRAAAADKPADRTEAAAAEHTAAAVAENKAAEAVDYYSGAGSCRSLPSLQPFYLFL